MIRACHLLLVSAASLGIVIGAWVYASASFFPICSIDFEEGQRLFKDRCSSCHSLSQARAGYGPNLNGIGTLAASRIPGMSAEHYLVESIVRPQAYRNDSFGGVMPTDISSDLSSTDVANLVGYLMMAGSSPNPRRLKAIARQIQVRSPSQHSRPRLVDAESGRSLFLGKGKCIECHLLRDIPGSVLLAPSLLTAGRHETSYLRQSICDPGHDVTSGYQTWTAYLASGSVHSGRLICRDAETATLLLQAPRRLLTIPLDDIERDADSQIMLRTAAGSTMPDGYREVLTEAEIDSIVAFLETLK